MEIAPHRFEPLAFWDSWFCNGRCKHCHLPKMWHPTQGYMKARAKGDRRSASVMRAVGEEG